MFLVKNLLGLETEEIRRKIRQIFPVLCGCLIPVSFGMMLGWPSLAYPYLLQWDISPIPISLDQTSLIAGFLMEGNSIGALFSTSKILSSKAGVFFSCCLQFFGWCVMFGANDIFGLLLSRSSVGFANGYGTGQLKRYIKETCEPELAATLTQYMSLGINVGVILIYSMGAFVSFRMMAVFAAIVPITAVITFGLIPKKLNKVTERRSTITKNVLNNIVTLDIAKIEKCLTAPKADEAEEKQVDVIKCLKNERNRNGLLLILLIVFLQQYTGGPANIVYSQIIFTATGNPHSKICSILYAIFFFITTFISLKFAKNFPRKANLLLSCGMCVIIISVMALYFQIKHYLLEMSPNFVWAPLFILFIFNAFHTFGIATVPMYIISEKIPKRGRNVANKFWTIHFSMSAVISTKIFQVLFGIYDMTVAYGFFVAVALAGFITIWVFMDNYDPEEEKQKWAEEQKVLASVESVVSKIEITKL